MGKLLANIITGFRLVCCIPMLFFPLFSHPFIILYLLCGFSDMVDGTIARRTNSCSEFGARLDSIADFLFVAVSFLKVFPVLALPGWLWIWIAVIAVIRIRNLTAGFLTRKKLIFLHTRMNKVTGLFLFLLPLTIPFLDVRYSAVTACSLASVSAIQEWYYIKTGR